MTTLLCTWRPSLEQRHLPLLPREWGKVRPRLWRRRRPSVLRGTQNRTTVDAEKWSLSAASRDPFLAILRTVHGNTEHADCTTMSKESRIYLRCALQLVWCPALTKFFPPEESGGGPVEFRPPPANDNLEAALPALTK